MSVGPFLFASCNLANINLTESVALDFRLSLCTLVLPRVSGVFLESIEGKALKSFWLHRAVGVLFGGCLRGWDTRVPAAQTSVGRASFSLSLQSASKTEATLPFFAGCHKDLLIGNDDCGPGS